MCLADASAGERIVIIAKHWMSRDEKKDGRIVSSS
tara:strand:+ start:28116 stop:28220 length:105 start_codon:yes stop_codon:yes gene_type:complete